jgi:hypothetical protein
MRTPDTLENDVLLVLLGGFITLSLFPLGCTGLMTILTLARKKTANNSISTFGIGGVGTINNQVDGSADPLLTPADRRYRASKIFGPLLYGRILLRL